MQDLTTGSVTSHLLRTTSYMLVSMVFQTLYVLVDLYWVGRLGTEAVAAVAISGNLMFLVLAATQMLGVGATTLVSHAAGRRDQARANLVFNQAQTLSVVAGVAFLVITLSLSAAYARLMSADEGTTSQAVEYLRWMVPAMALQFAMVAMGSALRGTGNFKPGMIVQTASVIINIVLAPVLIFGWGTGRPMGVAGAALASLIAIAVGVAWLATYFVGRSAYLTFAREHWRPDLKLWIEMLKIGLPAGAEFGMMALYLAVVYSVIRPFGAPAQAGFGIGLRIMQSGFLPIVALGFAVAPVAGQNFGARHPDRVRATFKAAATIATVGMIVFALLAHIAPAAHDRDLLRRPCGDRRRGRISPHLVVELRGLGADLRHVIDVPGHGQHHSLARDVVHPHRPGGHPGLRAVTTARLRDALDLVPVGRRRRAPDVDEPAHPAAGVPGSPRAGAGPLLIRGRLDRAPPGPGQRIIHAHPNLRTVFSRRGTGRISNR